MDGPSQLDQKQTPARFRIGLFRYDALPIGCDRDLVVRSGLADFTQPSSHPVKPRQFSWRKYVGSRPHQRVAADVEGTAQTTEVEF